MTFAMPNPAVLEAINRLNEALTQAEAALEASASVRNAARSRDAAIRHAIVELDVLIASLREKKDG